MRLGEYTFTQMSAGSSRRTTVREKAREAVADAILAAAETVALDQGFDNLTIAAIAAEAGVAVGTLYNYFPDRDGIIFALFAARRADFMPRITAAAEASAKLAFEPRLRAFMGELFAIFDAERTFLRLALAAEEMQIQTRPRGPTMMTQVNTIFEQLMREGAAKKLFPAARAPAYARMLHGATKALALWRVAENQPMTGDAELIVDLWLRGIGKS